MENTFTSNKKGTSGLLFVNPLIRKLSKINESSEEHVTYGGIAKKCAFFLIGILLGIALELILNRIDPIAITLEGEITYISLAATIAVLVCLFFVIITPIVAFLIRPAIPVAGTLCCMSIGYILTFLSAIIPEYTNLILLALVITLAIVIVMGALYGSGRVKVGKKFRTVVTILFWTSVLSGFLLAICYFIPGLQGAVTFILGNTTIGIIGSIVGIIIASLFLLVDFDTVQQAVENKLPKKYEWIGAFALVFSVIWLYLKVLDLLSLLQPGGK